jgi:hypothetical protein
MTCRAGSCSGSNIPQLSILLLSSKLEVSDMVVEVPRDQRRESIHTAL